MRGLTTAIVCFLAATGIADAQERRPTQKETAAIADCFKQKADTPEGIESCIFKLVADPCAEASGGSTAATSECFRVEQTIWDGILNAAHRELLAELDAPQKAALRKMQKAWIASRDATCGFYPEKIRGTMAITMSAGCLARETANRAQILKQFIGL